MPSVNLLFGPMLIGVFLNCILYGLVIMQCLIYYQTYKKDPLWIRLFVAYLFLVETVNTALDSSLVYEPLVTKFGSPSATTFFPTMLAADPIVTVLISTPIQFFVAWRISIITQSPWISGIIVFLAAIALGGGVWTSVTVVIVKRFVRKPELHWPALTWLSASALADIAITSSLTYSLARRKTGFSSTDNSINRIIRLTIQTGFVTAIFAALDVICFLVLPHTTINFVWDLALSKLCNTNALLSSLNARASWNAIANGSALTHNILFGDPSLDANGAIGMYTRPNLTFNPANSQLLSSGVYELTTTTPTATGLRDSDYAIPVLKEVETR